MEYPTLSASFPSSFSNIPLINLREEFKATRALLDSSEVESWFTPPWQYDPIQAPQFVWYGNPEDCVFRAKPDTGSGASRTLIPDDAGQHSGHAGHPRRGMTA